MTGGGNHKPPKRAVVVLAGGVGEKFLLTSLCGGLTLLDRLLRQLKKVGVSSVILLNPCGDCVEEIRRGQGGSRWRWPADIEVIEVEPGSDPLALPALLRDQLPDRFLYLKANILIDQRLLERLMTEPRAVLLQEGSALAAVLDRSVLEHGGVSRATRLRPSDIDDYDRELRRRIAPYFLGITSSSEIRQGFRVLLKHIQKGALDLPGRYFDTPFENILVRLIAPTRITPNLVTLATTTAAVGVGLLFWVGWLKLAAFLALLIGILDGVDGKLARLRLETSRLGELEHIGDFFYENGWYLAIASHLGLLPVGLLMVCADLGDNLAYMVVQRRHGRLLDEMSSFDRGFRQIAGRRNIYVWIFVVGFCSSSAAATFVAACGWALTTALIHWLRALRWLDSPGNGKVEAPRNGRALTAATLESEPVAREATSTKA